MRQSEVSEPVEAQKQQTPGPGSESRRAGNHFIGRLHASLRGALQAIWTYRMRSFTTASGPFFGTIVAMVAVTGIASIQALVEVSRSTRLIVLLCASCAVLALLVGSFLSTRSMLTSVAERVGEMSMRKVVGARGGDIACQLIMEVLLLSGIGTVAGLVPGLLIGAGMMVLLQLTPVLHPILILLVCCGSIVAAGIGGVFPALRAAHIEPGERPVRASARSHSMTWR